MGALSGQRLITHYLLTFWRPPGVGCVKKYTVAGGGGGVRARLSARADISN